MASAALLRRRDTARGTTSWSPAALPGVVAWWHGADVAGADGAAITTWTDRVGSLAATQGTAGRRPTVLASGLNGQRGVSFAAGSSQYLQTAGIGSVPQTGPFTVLIVLNPSSGTSQGIIGVTDPGVYSKGWVLEVSAGNLFYGVAGGTNANGRGVILPGGSGGSAEVQVGATTSITINANNWNYNTTTTSVPTTGATNVTLGWDGIGTHYLTGDVYDIIVLTGSVSRIDRYQFAAWIRTTYGLSPLSTSYNTPSYAATPTPYPTNQTCVESSILKLSSPINGHSLYNVFVPITNENPSVNVSDDGGFTWTVPAGVTNPIVAALGVGQNSDPCLLDNRARDGKLWLFYQVDNQSGPLSTGGIWYTTSTDGKTWTAVTQLVAPSVALQFQECKVWWNAGTSEYWLLCLNHSNNDLPFTRKATTIAGLATASDLTATITLPGNRKLWHMGNPCFLNSKWVLGFSDQDYGGPNHGGNIWLTSSTDGVTWTVADKPLIRPGDTGSWDEGGCYRLNMVDAGDGQTMTVWYNSGVGTTGSPQMSTAVTVPLTAIP